MTKHLGLVVWATGALVLVVVAACGGSEPGSAPPSNSASVSPTSPSPATASPTPKSPSEQAAADATATVRAYFATVDRLGQEPGAPVSSLRRVATGTLLAAQRRAIAKQRQRQEHQVGDVRLVDLKVQAVNLDDSAPAEGRVPIAQVDVCWDVTGVDVLDAQGNSVVKATRPNGGVSRYFLENRMSSTNPDDGWRVSNAQDLKLGPCSAV